MNVLAAATLPELTRIAGTRLPADGSVGVRPEYVRVVSVDRGIAAKVELVEALGSDTLIHTRVGANVPLVSRQNERTALKLGAGPTTRIISFTVTEAGYCRDSDNRLETSYPELASDLAGTTRSTIYGALAAILDERRRRGSGPVTLLNCDNLRSNGERFGAG